MGRSAVGWKSQWTEECVGWVGEVLHCVGRKSGWMGGWWVWELSEQYWELSRWYRVGGGAG